MQRALLGEIPPKLRMVSVSWTDTSIHFDCFFDGEVSDDDAESMSLVETELMAKYPETHKITHAVHRWDFPQRFPPGDGVRVFRRREYQP